MDRKSEADDDVLLPREQITERIHATDGQFKRAKGYIRGHVTMEKGKLFLAYRGGYMITTDPAKITEIASLRIHRLNTELRRALSGSINPCGDQGADCEVLATFQDEIAHMTRTRRVPAVRRPAFS